MFNNELSANTTQTKYIVRILLQLMLIHKHPKLTSTSIVPARRRAPKIISKEPVRKRNIAKAIALYGTFGGLFLNWKEWDKIHDEDTLTEVFSWLTISHSKAESFQLTGIYLQFILSY